ncbi:MAG: DUF1850 domain-containing protein [Desulfobacterota bacterium]|nr:DUF1850 domain-containing protein [Thermodesulfobacteriota bacterium]
MAWSITAGVGAGALLLLWPLFPVLEIVEGRSGRTAFCTGVRPGDELVLAFVHSVNRRPVYDTLRVEADHLVIVRSRFDSFGAGMPEASTQDGTLTLAPDGWLEWTVNRPAPEVTVRVGRVAEHTLHYKGQEIRLSDLAEPGSALTLRIRKSRWLDRLRNRCAP